MKVLIADDDRALSHLVTTLLRARGWTVIPAFDAMQALMFAMRSPVPDAIILDIAMPGGTGVDVLKKLKASSKTMLIPVVVLSAVSDPGLPAEVRSLGAEEFLPKPVDAEALVSVLQRVAAAGK